MMFIPRQIQDILEVKVALERFTTFLNQPEVNLSTCNVSSGTITLEDATIAWPKAETSMLIQSGLEAFSLRGLNFCIPKGRLSLVCGPLGSGKTLLVGIL